MSKFVVEEDFNEDSRKMMYLLGSMRRFYHVELKPQQVVKYMTFEDYKRLIDCCDLLWHLDDMRFSLMLIIDNIMKPFADKADKADKASKS